MAERFTDRLRKRADAVWEAQHNHPFVRGIGEGTLDFERFKFWLRQDYVFLIEYGRLLALAAARAPDLATMSRFAALLSETLETEMSLHRSYAAQFGISNEDLEAEEKAPVTQGYTDFLVRTAATGDFAELVAALLPCMWGFCEIGQRLATSAEGGFASGEGPQPADERYRRWIEMYSSPDFAALADWCRELLDRLAAGRSEEELSKLEAAFLTSSRYEYLFWEMAYRQEEWPV